MYGLSKSNLDFNMQAIVKAKLAWAPLLKPDFQLEVTST